MKRAFHLIYWSSISLFLFLLFFWYSRNGIYAFYFLTFFLPVVIAASLLFMEKLIPQYLLQRKYGSFVLYTLATLVVSGNLLMVLSFVSLYLLGLYDPGNLHLIMDHFRQLPLVMFLIILFSGFVGLLHQYMKLSKAEGAAGNSQAGFLTVRSDRRNRTLPWDTIIYIESMADYVRIFISEGEKVITRERISGLQEKLPAQFIRIHRSYIVNRHSIDSYTREEVLVKGNRLPLSRTYKNAFLTSMPTA